MNSVELKEFRNVIQDLDDCRHRNIELEIQIRNLKAEIAKNALNNQFGCKKEGEDS